MIWTEVCCQTCALGKTKRTRSLSLRGRNLLAARTNSTTRWKSNDKDQMRSHLKAQITFGVAWLTDPEPQSSLTRNKKKQQTKKPPVTAPSLAPQRNAGLFQLSASFISSSSRLRSEVTCPGVLLRSKRLITHGGEDLLVETLLGLLCLLSFHFHEFSNA